MRNRKLIKAVIIALGATEGVFLPCSASIAAAVNPEVANINYWYGDEDIRAVLTNRLGTRVGTSVYIAPAVPSGAPELATDIARAAINEARGGKVALLPINLNNNHWAAMAIRVRSNGDLVVLYNDSLGGGISNGNASGELSDAIAKLVPDVKILDLQVRGQSDGSSCGAFTAENLIAFSNLDPGSLTAEQAKAALEEIRDRGAQSIRLLHFNALSSLYDKIVTAEEIAEGKVLQSAVEAVSNKVLTDILSLSLVTRDRLGDLHLAGSGFGKLSGFSGGEGEASACGIWAQGSLAFGKDKGKQAMSHKAKVFTIGFDSKVDEDLTLGIAVSASGAHLKPAREKAQTTTLPPSINSAVTKSLAGSIYGSAVPGDNFLISGSASIGKLTGSVNYLSLMRGGGRLKLKGNFQAANLEGSYYLFAGNFFFCPVLGAAYEEVNFSKGKGKDFSASKVTLRKLSINPAAQFGAVFETGGVRLIPQISIGIFCPVFFKAGQMVIKNDEGRVVATGNSNGVRHAARQTGVSFTLAGEHLELSGGFENLVQNRYEEKQGFVKLRVNI